MSATGRTTIKVDDGDYEKCLEVAGQISQANESMPVSVADGARVLLRRGWADWCRMRAERPPAAPGDRLATMKCAPGPWVQRSPSIAVRSWPPPRGGIAAIVYEGGIEGAGWEARDDFGDTICTGDAIGTVGRTQADEELVAYLEGKATEGGRGVGEGAPAAASEVEP